MYAALTRPRLLAGCERKPFIALLMGAIALPYFAEDMFLALVTVPFAVGAILLLRNRNKVDPQWMEVYMRSLHYQDFYPAKACIRAPVATNWSKPFG